MRVQFRRLGLHQIRFYVLDDPVAHVAREKIDNRLVKLRGCGKRPAFEVIALHDLGNLIGELFINAPIGFVLQFRLRSRCSRVRTGAIGRISPGRIGELVAEFAVRVRRIERLHEVQTRPARGRFIDPISFQTSAIRNNDERGGCHSHNILLSTRARRVLFFYNPFTGRDKAARQTISTSH